MNRSKEYYVTVGPFVFSVRSDISSLHHYIEHHYSDCLLESSGDHFVDYYVEVNHGSLYRRLYKPQADFKFNHQSPFKPLPLNQAHAFLEWGMNWVIASQAHQYFILHAATVAKGDQAIIISAPSGSGKSTLCAYLVSKGWRLLSDELALIDPNTMQLYGLGRPINLKNDSIELLRKHYKDKQFSKVVKDTHKGTISLLKASSSNTKVSNAPVRPAQIVFVHYTKDENCYAESVEPAIALTEIIRNSFNINVLNKAGFQCAKELVTQTPATYIEYNNFHSCEQAILSAMNNTLKNEVADAY